MKTTTANLPLTDLESLAAGFGLLTGAKKISADVLKNGTDQKVYTTAEQTAMTVFQDNIRDTLDYMSFVAYEQTIANLGTTQQTTINVPSGEKMIGFAFNVESAITFSGGGSTLTITIDDGSTVATIQSGVAAAKNTKVSKVLAQDLDAVTNIKLAANTGSFNSGSVKIVVITQRMKALADA